MIAETTHSDVRYQGTRHETDNKIKEEIIKHITSHLMPLERTVVIRLLSDTQIIQQVHEYIDKTEGEDASSTGIHTSKVSTMSDPQDERQRMKYRYGIDRLLTSNPLSPKISTIWRTIKGDDVVGRVLNSEGASCLDASAAAAFLMMLDRREAWILGWNSSQKGFVRDAYRSLLHEHYCVVFIQDDGQPVIMDYTGLLLPIDLCRRCISTPREEQAPILREIFSIPDEDPIPETAQDDVRRMKRMVEAYDLAILT